jgi:hypothetical protein
VEQDKSGELRRAGRKIAHSQEWNAPGRPYTGMRASSPAPNNTFAPTRSASNASPADNKPRSTSSIHNSRALFRRQPSPERRPSGKSRPRGGRRSSGLEGIETRMHQSIGRDALIFVSGLPPVKPHSRHRRCRGMGWRPRRDIPAEECAHR